jgi:hypothetical protein
MTCRAFHVLLVIGWAGASGGERSANMSQQQALRLAMYGAPDDEPPPARRPSTAVPPGHQMQSLARAMQAGRCRIPLPPGPEDDCSAEHRAPPAPAPGPTDGRGSYARGGGKGQHHSWASRAAEHIAMVDGRTWLQAAPCRPKCAFNQSCLSRVLGLDARDCAIDIFGHCEVDRAPTSTHTAATDRWFQLLLNCQMVDPATGAIGLRFKLQPPASPVLLCSEAMCFLYGAPHATWDSMVRAVLAGSMNWRDRALAKLRIDTRSGETKLNDAAVWWLSRIQT